MLNWIFKNILAPSVPQKSYESWAARRPPLAPDFSFVIQSHNKAENVCRLVDDLRSIPNSEIIVLDDGSTLEQSATLARHLKGGNEFLLRSHDLYEVITYDRALYFARGKWVALMQDDQAFDGSAWVENAKEHFRKYSNLAILGGKVGLNFVAFDKSDDGRRGDYEESGEFCGRKNSFKARVIGIATPEGKSSFRYVQSVNRGPMWVDRMKFLEKLHHIDQSYAPFQWDDAELCLRAWSVGFEVAWYPVAFKGVVDSMGGMRLWNQQLHHVQDENNARKLYERWGSRLVEIQALVDRANQKNL